MTTESSIPEWRLLDPVTEGEAFWNACLEKLSGFGYTQLYEWGEHRRAEGWTPLRWLAEDDNGPVTMVQVLYKPASKFLGLLWIPGGPAGDVDLLDVSFIRDVSTEVKAPIIYARLLVESQKSDEGCETLARKGWRPTKFKLRSGLTAKMVLKDRHSLYKGISRDWRGKLNKFRRSGLRIELWNAPEVDSMLTVFSEMESIKNLARLYTKQELSSFLDHFSGRLNVFRCVNREGSTIAIDSIIVTKKHGWIPFAAANSEARKAGVGNALKVHLLEHCIDIGIVDLDYCGIDPERNPGVTKFKLRSGAVPYEYLGEWSWSNLPGLCSAIDLGLTLRRRLRAH